MGRRKISIAPIADDRNRSVTFLKRKNGLFKKAYELGILCSADVAVVVFNNTGKLFEFSSGDMDGILMKYSHYSGPQHEKRGPADYASKDVDEIAKKGLGGKMTTLSDEDEELEGVEDGTGGDESSGEEKKKKGKKAVARRSSVKSQASSQQQRAESSPPPAAFDPSRGVPQQQQQPQQPQQPQQQPYNPYAQQQQQPFNPYLPPSAQSYPQHLMQQHAQQQQQHPWASYPLPPTQNGRPHPLAGLSQAPPSWGYPLPQQQQPTPQQQWGMPPPSLYPNGLPQFHNSPSLPGTPDLSALQAAYHQSQVFFPLPPPFQPPQQPVYPSQNAFEHPRETSTRSTPSKVGRTAVRQDSGRSDASGSVPKPRLSVSIPSGGAGSSSGTAPLVERKKGETVYTAEPEGIEEGEEDAQPSTASRFAADLLPSPSRFLTDITYDGFSLSGLNTATADSVFSWPKPEPAVGPAPALRPDEAPGLFGEGVRRKRTMDEAGSGEGVEEEMEVDETARESGEEGSVKKSRI